MIQPAKYAAINWTDGMKISQKHFTAQENYMLDLLRDTGSLYITKFNYGLLPSQGNITSKDTIFDVYNTATNDVQLLIKNCEAVTPAGYRISLANHTVNVKSLVKTNNDDTESGGADFYILISVNPFERVPFGDIDPEETPPRHPYTLPKYFIELLPVSSLRGNYAGGNYLIIGKVSIQNDIAKADEDFIPPCTSLYSHPVLLNSYTAFAKSIGNLQQYVFKIIQRAAVKNQHTNTTLAQNIKALCNTMTDYFGNNYFRYRNIIPNQPPVYLINTFASLSLCLYNQTQLLLPVEKEEMFNYIFEWSEVPPHVMLNRLSSVAEINYDHNNCGEYLIKIKTLLGNLETVFEKLSGLDYVGQRKENIIVTEKDITPVQKAPKGWSILD